MGDVKLPKGIFLRKDGLYMGRFKHQGQTYTIYGRNWRKLEKELSDYKYEITHGLKSKGANMTLNTWFNTWLYDFKRLTIKESTFIRYQNQYDLYIRKEIGMRKMDSFKPIIIQRLVNKLAAADYSTKTIADIHSLLHGIFRVAVQNNVILTNPCEAVVLPKTKEKEIRVLSVEEQKEILKFSKGRTCESLVRVALGTGLRAGELLALTWEDIDFQKREIYVNKTLVYIRDVNTNKYRFKFQTPKTKSGNRTIPMQESVYEALKEQYNRIQQMKKYAKSWNVIKGFENLVFLNSTGRPKQVIDFRNTLRVIEKAINEDRKKRAEEEGIIYSPIQHFSCHSLRHAFATRCLEANIDVKVIQRILGHSHYATTMDIYVHATNDKTREEMNKLEGLYKEIE